MSGDSTYGLNTGIHERVDTDAGGNPIPETARQLLAKIDDDEFWFPGKRYGFMGGRPKALLGTKRAVIAKMAMAMKATDEATTWEFVVARDPRAAINPKIGKPDTKKISYDVLRTLRTATL